MKRKLAGSTRPWLPLALALALLLGACAQTPVPTSEDAPTLSPLATFRVNSRADAPDANPGDGRCATAAGECTLRAAIQETNALPGADTVRLPRGTFTLTLGELVITDGLTLSGVNENALVGGGGRRTVIDAGGRSRVFFIDRAGLRPGVTLRGLTIRNGNERFSGYGAGVIVSSGSGVTLERVIVRDNVARVFGAGISNFGILTVRQSTVYNNRMPTDGGVTNSGGGIFNGGILGLYDSTVYDNEATRGGGISTTRNSATVISNSTISGNKAAARGGGILNFGGIMNITSSTITRNEAAAFNRLPGFGEDYFGGGIYNMGRLTLSGTLLTENTQGIREFDRAFAPDCYSPDSTRISNIRTYGANLVGVVNGNCAFPTTRPSSRPPDLLGTQASPASPMLLELANNGGPTLTHALRPYSRAVDRAGRVSSGTNACSDRDQRGERRPFDGNRDGEATCDIGAFEAQEAPPRDTVAPTCQVGPHPRYPDEVLFTFRDNADGSGSGLYRVYTTYTNNVSVGTVYGFRGGTFVAGTSNYAEVIVRRDDPTRRAAVIFIVEDAAGNRAVCGSAVPI